MLSEFLDQRSLEVREREGREIKEEEKRRVNLEEKCCSRFLGLADKTQSSWRFSHEHWRKDD